MFKTTFGNTWQALRQEKLKIESSSNSSVAQLNVCNGRQMKFLHLSGFFPLEQSAFSRLLLEAFHDHQKLLSS